MIDSELRSRIRRLFFGEHWKMGTIVAELDVHRDTVELAIERDRFINVPYRATASSLDVYKDFIRTTLEDYPRLRATRLACEVEQQVSGGNEEHRVGVGQPARTATPSLRQGGSLDPR